MFKFSFLTVLFIALTIFAHAEEVTHFSEKELIEIKQQLNLSNSIYQIALNASEKSLMPLSESAWIKDLEESSTKLLRMSYQVSVTDEEKLVTRFKNMIKWKNLWGQVKSLAPKIKSYSRINGLGLVFAVVATAPSEIVGPIIVTALGRPDLIPVAVAFPTTGIAVGGQVAIQRFFVKRELIKSMGSRDIYQAFVETSKEYRNQLKMTKMTDYLHQFNQVGEELELLVIQKENYLSKMKEIFGLEKTNITYSKVMDFCTRRNLLEEDFFIKGISEMSELPKEYRAGLILEHLRKTGDEILIDDIYAWFGDGIVKVSLTNDMESTYRLAKELSQLETLAELHQKIMELPSDTNAKLLAEVWKNRVIKDLSLANKDLNHFEFRRMVNNFTKLYGTIQSQEGEVLMDAQIKTQWQEYLSSVSSSKLTCNDQYSPI